MKTVKFYTLGCKVNQYDTQAMREQLWAAGFRDAPEGKKAGVCVVNTCTVTQAADKESLYVIRRAKKENPRARVIVTGCLAETGKEAIAGAAAGVVVAGNNAKAHIARLLGAQVRGNGGITRFSGHTRAFVKIQDGCDNFCAYCKVPFVRGRLKSRPLKEIACEVERLVKNGSKEIVLTGICLGAYGKESKAQVSLPLVLQALEKIEGLARIRLSSLEPGDITPALLAAIKNSSKVCRHLHVPLQSGDTAILKAMHRTYSQEEYLALIRRIKRMLPGISITTDVLVGFPGESEAHFANTLKTVQRILPLKVHVFAYSRREGTYAAGNLAAQEISREVKEARAARLKKVAQECAQKVVRQWVHKNVQVLIEGPAKGNPGFWEGHTDTYIRVQVKTGRNCKNSLVQARPDGVLGEALIVKNKLNTPFFYSKLNYRQSK